MNFVTNLNCCTVVSEKISKDVNFFSEVFSLDSNGWLSVNSSKFVIYVNVWPQKSADPDP